METLKNKKGFTLIELLAVIVVLGIVMVIGTTTVLPLLEDSRKNAVETEAKAAIEAASNAVSLISIGNFDNDYYKKDNNYCFTLSNLKDAGLWKKNDITGYSGYVTAVKDNDTGNYTYTISMRNGSYKLDGNSSSLTTVADTATTAIACPTGYTAVE